MLAMVVLGLTLASCGPPRPERPEANIEDPSLLVSTDDMGADVSVEQTVTATHRGRHLTFRAVIQKHADSLTVVAFTAQGQRAFVLTQKQKQVQFEQQSGPELPFSPWHILLDIHRIYFYSPERRAAVPDVTIQYQGAGSSFEQTVHYENRARNYTLAIKPVRVTWLTSSE
jgi:hypothetical protein